MYIALVSEPLAKIFEAALPDEYSKPLDLARPIWGTVAPLVDCSVPREPVAVLYKLTALKASTSPETNPTSGEP